MAGYGFNRDAKNRISRAVLKSEGNRSGLTSNFPQAVDTDVWFWAVVRNNESHSSQNGWYTVIASTIGAMTDETPVLTERQSSDPLYLEVRALNIREAIVPIGDVADGETARVFVASDNNEEPYFFFEAGGGAGLWAEITSSTLIDDNRWQYGIAQVEYKKEGTWQAVTGGISGVGYNTIETPNGATGIQGNGVNVANLPPDVSLVPLGIGAVVRAYPVINCETGGTEYALEAVNQVDGTCS